MGERPPGTLFEIVGSSDGTRRSLPIRCLAGFVLRVQSIVRTVKSLPSWYSLLEAQRLRKRAAKELAKRFEHVTVFGRDGAILAEQFQRLGLLVSIAGEELT